MVIGHHAVYTLVCKYCRNTADDKTAPMYRHTVQAPLSFWSFLYVCLFPYVRGGTNALFYCTSCVQTHVTCRHDCTCPCNVPCTWPCMSVQHVPATPAEHAQCSLYFVYLSYIESNCNRCFVESVSYVYICVLVAHLALSRIFIPYHWMVYACRAQKVTCDKCSSMVPISFISSINKKAETWL